MMVLADVKQEGSFRVKQLHALGDMHRHLEEMGFIPGERITVVSRNAGNIIVSVKGSRVALSKELASSIIV